MQNEKQPLHVCEIFCLQSEALKLIAKHPSKVFYEAVVGLLKEEKTNTIHAIITLKSFKNESSAEILKNFLESENPSLAGRALDTLTALPGLRAKRLIIDYLKNNPENDDICDKVIRCLDPPESHVEYFTNVVDEILKKFPDHKYRDGLLLLREKLSQHHAHQFSIGHAPKGVEIQSIDQELSVKISDYVEYDDDIKSTLRSAELPYKRRELFDESVDKAYAIVQYCKGVDLLLEKNSVKSICFQSLKPRYMNLKIQFT